MSDVEEQKQEEKTRGYNGVVGTATASLTIKQRYHQAYFSRLNAGSKSNPNKKIWVKNDNAPSLKQFARKLSSTGDSDAKEWFSNKNGLKNEKRSDANVKAAHEAGAATKLKKKASGKK